MASLIKPSCMKCSKYIACRDPLKGPKHSCKSFVRLKEIGSFEDLYASISMIPQGVEDPDIALEKETSGIKIRDLVDATPGIAKTKRVLDGVKIATPEEVKGGVNDVEGDFIWQAMQSSYDPFTNSVRDIKIDDRALKLSTNYYHFCTKIAGSAIKAPFSRQLYVAMILLGEYCPRCTDEKWLDIMNVPVDMESKDLVKRVVLLDNGVCPKCSATKSGLILGGEMKDYNELAIVQGQRSGKSAFSSTLSAYLLHRYMKAPRMSDICRGIQEFTPLTATFVGLTAARAIKNLWNPFMSIVNGSTWFTEYFEILRDYGRRYDKELYKRAGLYLRIFHRNLDLYPAPPLKRTLRGDTRFLGATDELSFFNFNPNKNADGEDDDEEKEHADGEEVQQSLSNSLTTVRTEVLHLYKKGINTIPTGYNLSMSSPFSENDTLCRLERDSHNEDSLTFGIRLPTWEVNPLYQRNHPIIVEAYRRNPVKAERDFGANPPQITSALYQPGTIEMLFTPGRPNSHRLLYLDHVKYTRGKSVHVTPKDAYQPAIMTLDAGLVNNAFAMVVAHRRDATMEVDLVIELVPQPGKQVDFPFLYENIILPIIKDMNVVLVSADRWNSINILQQIEKDVEGCKVSQKTLQYKDFTHFSASVYAGEVKLPALEMPMDRVLVVRDFKKELLNAPISHLALQMTTVKDTGVAIVKGDGYTDDMFRALVLNHQQMFSTKHKTHMNRARIKSSTAQKTDKSRAFVISASRSIYSRGGM